MRDMVGTAPGPNMQERVRALTELPWFRNVILIVIAVNGVTLGLETSPTVMAAAGGFLHVLDKTFLAIFVVEILLRLYGNGPRFFRDAWSLFDFAIVAVALAPASESFTVLRAVRILRALRLISAVPRMRRVVSALLSAVPGIGAIGLLLGLIFYVFSVIATRLFGEAFPQWFGTIGESMYSLFQIMTLESWSMGIVRPVMEQFPQAWAFFVPFIVASSFTVLNLFIAIIVDSLQTLHRSEQEGAVEEVSDVVHSDVGHVSDEIALLRRDIQALRESIERKT